MLFHKYGINVNRQHAFLLSLNSVGLFNETVTFLCSQEEFLQKSPNGINPVSANDVFFSLHALLFCIVYVIQAAVYEVWTVTSTYLKTSTFIPIW